MIYIGQYKGNPVYYEVLFVAKTCNQTCNKLQDFETYCGASMMHANATQHTECVGNALKMDGEKE